MFQFGKLFLQRVEFLFARYEKLTAPLLPATPALRWRECSCSAGR